MARRRALDMSKLNTNLVRLQYAVRGPIFTRALEIQTEIEKPSKLSVNKNSLNFKPIHETVLWDAGAGRRFDSVIKANVGDSQAMGQNPLTFLRQVLACCYYPTLVDSNEMPPDVAERAKMLLKTFNGGSIGSYTIAQGIELIRRHASDFIEARDGYPSRWQDICLTAGATDGIKKLLKCFVPNQGNNTGIMIPIPQYPLYSASFTEVGIEPIYYYLDEDKGWALTINELERSLNAGKEAGIDIRAIVVINPGNPTGQVLTEKNIEDIVKFAHKNGLFIFADEVYQQNIYDPESTFHSFKKVTMMLGSPYDKEIELASFMSASKGYIGECGIRGGYVELLNMDPEVQTHLYKTMSAMLCPTVAGQACMDLVVRPPQLGEPSYELWAREKDAVLRELAARAKLVADTFNSMPGFKCNTVQGAMYAFPSFEIPPKALEAAHIAKQQPDVFYAFQLLEETGICVVPGSGFGQREGTWHFRTTILPQEPLLTKMLSTFATFQQRFYDKYS